VGWDCLADIAEVRAEQRVFGLVASGPTVSRTIDRLAHDTTRALAAIDTAGPPPAPGCGVWPVSTPPTTRPTRGSPLVIDGGVLSIAWRDTRRTHEVAGFTTPSQLQRASTLVAQPLALLEAQSVDHEGSGMVADRERQTGRVIFFGVLVAGFLLAAPASPWNGILSAACALSAL
jgi:hypothetical protein